MVRARREGRVLTRHRMVAVQHHDLPSLMAGKVHALVTRRYAKGRDWFDLLWYRGRRPPVEPNLVLLQHALDQTEGAGAHRAAEWKRLVTRRLARLDARKLAEDVRPFLERPGDGDVLTAENISSALRG